jgi:hypothetical protein
LKVGLDLEAIKVGMNYPNGQSEDLDAGWPDERAPSALFVVTQTSAHIDR